MPTQAAHRPCTVSSIDLGPEPVAVVEMFTHGRDERPDVMVDRPAAGAPQMEVFVRMRTFPADRITAAELARADQAELLEQREHPVGGRAVDAAAQRLRALDDLVDAQVRRMRVGARARPRARPRSGRVARVRPRRRAAAR